MKYVLAIALIGLALAGRVLPHPDNFTPVLAVALFGGAMFTSAAAACFVPLAAMVLSDLLLGTGFNGMSVFVYASFAAATLLGRSLGRRRGWRNTMLAVFSGSLLFYVVTNFGVWLLGEGAHARLYPRTLEGLVQCYWVALPFFRNSLAGDLVWTAMLFSIFDLARARIRVPAAAA